MLVEAQFKDEKLVFIDFPTIIAGINYSISNLLPQDYNKYSSDYDTILDRELRRFITTLKRLLIRNNFDEMVFVTRDTDICSK